MTLFLFSYPKSDVEVIPRENIIIPPAVKRVVYSDGGVRPSVRPYVRLSVPPPSSLKSALSALKSVLPGLKSALSGLKSGLSSLSSLHSLCSTGLRSLRGPLWPQFCPYPAL